APKSRASQVPSSTAGISVARLVGLASDSLTNCAGTAMTCCSASTVVACTTMASATMNETPAPSIPANPTSASATTTVASGVTNRRPPLVTYADMGGCASHAAYAAPPPRPPVISVVRTRSSTSACWPTAVERIDTPQAATTSSTTIQTVMNDGSRTTSAMVWRGCTSTPTTRRIPTKSLRVLYESHLATVS